MASFNVSPTSLMLFFYRLWDTVLTALGVSLFLFVMFWISACFYASFYLIYMPSQTTEFPVDFSFIPCKETRGKCSYLEGEISFLEELLPKETREESTAAVVAEAPTATLQPDNLKFLVPGHSYSISLELEIPTTENNVDHGMFMSCLTLMNKDFLPVKNSCRSSLVPYKSDFLRQVEMLFFVPWYLVGISKESLKMEIEYLGDFRDDTFNPALHARIEIKSRFLDVSSSKMKIHSRFLGLRHFMYHYPVICSSLFISLISIILCSVILALWFRIFKFLPNFFAKIGFKNSKSKTNCDLNERHKKAREILNRSKNQRPQQAVISSSEESFTLLNSETQEKISR